MSDRERWLARAFVDLAGGLVDDLDVVDLLTMLCERCTELFEGAEAGIVLVGDDRQLRAVASSSEALHDLEVVELAQVEGPCLDAYRSGVAVWNASLDRSPWPSFERKARAAGFRVVHAVPLRHQDEVLGALNVFDKEPREVDDRDAEIVHALADAATAAVLQVRALRAARNLSEQLQGALRSRVVVEQAKGILAERLHIEVDAAFDALRTYARNRNLQLAEVARSLVAGELGIEALEAEARRAAGRRSRSSD